MSRIKMKNIKKSTPDIKEDNFPKCKLFDDKTSFEMKTVISKLSMDCIATPSDQNKKLKELFSILENKLHGKSIILRKSVLVSLCLIYRDILPTYKITVLSDQQKQQNMKKDTIKVYSEEEILLGHYQRYIRVIESVLKKQYNIESLNHIKWTESDELTLLKCACNLYKNNPNFNFSSTLLKLIVPNLMSLNAKLLKYASKTIEDVIKDDIKLEAANKICEAVKQFATINQFNIRSTLLKPLLHMELEDVNINDTTKVNTHKVLSRNQKKEMKKNKRYVQKCEEISAKESLNVKYNNNSLVIRCMFYIFFRILKRNNISSKLLETILEGIGKYGRLVDCKLFPDIFAVMLKICQNSKISMENRLRSMYVSLDIVTSGKASDILDFDPSNFCNKLIELAGHLNLSEKCVVLVINCSTKLLVKRRNHISDKDSTEIITTLIKLAWNHKNVQHICSVTLVSLVRYLRLYPQMKCIFDDDEELENNLIGDKKSANYYNSLSFLRDLCKLSFYEISGIAKRIKKFFSVSEEDNSMLELKGSLEDLTRMKTEECLTYLKEKLQKPSKRLNNDVDGNPIKKPKME